MKIKGGGCVCQCDGFNPNGSNCECNGRQNLNNHCRRRRCNWSGHGCPCPCPHPEPEPEPDPECSQLSWDTLLNKVKEDINNNEICIVDININLTCLKNAMTPAPPYGALEPLNFAEPAQTYLDLFIFLITFFNKFFKNIGSLS